MKTPPSRRWSGCAFRRLAATTLLASTTAVHALPTVVDAFLTGGSDYATGTGNLVTQGPTALGFSGTWLQAPGTAQSPDVISTGLSYSVISSAGGAIEYPAPSSGRAGRLLTAPYGDTHVGTVYYGVMIQLNSATDTGYRGLELHNGSFGDDGTNRRLQIVIGEAGAGVPATNFGVRVNGNNGVGFIGDLGAINTNVNFFLVKVTFSATPGQDVVSIWRDPTDLSSETGSGTADFTSTGLDFAFDRVSFPCFSATGYKADEIRIGNAWTDVTTGLGIANVDGVRDDALYSTPLVVQTVNTEFGNNLNEWNAGYAYVNAGKLYLFFSGNLENNSNRLEIFIDSKSGGSNIFTSAGNDGAGNMNGMKFDTAFAPDYHLIARRSPTQFDLDFANLITPVSNSYSNLFGGSNAGSGFTGTGTNTKPICVGYDGSNILGISGGTGAANQTAAAAVQTGLELCIDLADLGSPTGPIRVMLLQNNPSHGFISNQSLGGLPAGSGNLGGPGGPPTVDFSAYAGDQFFNVDPSPVHLFGNNTAIRFTATGLTIGGNYIVQESTTLIGFADIVGSDFIATNAVQVISAPVNTGTTPKYFLRVKEVPAQ